MTPSLSSEPLALRRPAPLFVFLALALLYAIALAFAALASAGFSAFALLAAHGLAVPAAIGTLLTALSIGQRLRRGALRTRGEIVARAAIAFATAGFVWPLSFGIAVMLQGDSGAALGALAPALAGLCIGAASGALGGAAAAWTACAPLKPAPTS